MLAWDAEKKFNVINLTGLQTSLNREAGNLLVGKEESGYLLTLPP